MINSTQLAGFFAAHSIWCVSSGETLTPILAFTTESGERHMRRLSSDDLSVAVEQGQRRLDTNEMNAVDAVLLYDGRIPIGSSKCDAIIIEIRSYLSPDSRAVMAVPYTPKSFLRRFLVHKPKLVQWDNCDQFDMNSALEAFFAGVSEHEKGAEVWNKALDESK